MADAATKALSDMVDKGDDDVVPAASFVAAPSGGGGLLGVARAASGSASSSSGGVAASPPPLSNNYAEKLYVRVGQPVEGCELEPFATLVLRNQQVGQEHSYKWSRTAASAFPCAYSRCKQNEGAMVASVPDSSVGSGSGHASLAATVRASAARNAAGAVASASPLQCLACLRSPAAGAVQSVFCSPRCLTKGWAEHAQYHARQALAATREKATSAAATSSSSSGGGDVLDKDATLFVGPLALATSDLTRLAAGTVGGAAASARGGNAKQQARGGSGSSSSASAAPSAGAAASVAVGASALALPVAEEWTLISTDRALTPGPLDVGHRFRLEVTARAGPDRTVSQVAETPPVLPRPAPCARRRFLLAPRAQPPQGLTLTDKEKWFSSARRNGLRDLTGGSALRIACWNVLAEIYASASMVRE